jgi:hypothetical protein
MPQSNEQRVFTLSFPKTDYYPSSSFPYHIFKFLAMAYAKTRRPDNFPNPLELRFFQEGYSMFAATYSDYIPDTSGVIARRNKSMGQYYSAESKERAEAVRKKSDMFERKRNPLLIRAVREMFNLGICLPHPEANFHAAENGTPVFFEIDELSIMTCLDQARFENDRRSKKAQKLLALTYTIALKLGNLEGAYSDHNKEIRQIGLKALYSTIFKLFSDPRKTHNHAELIGKVIRSGICWDYFYFFPIADLKVQPLPCKFDRSIHQFFRHYSGELTNFRFA